MKTQAKKLTAFLLALVLVLSGLLTVSVLAEEDKPRNEVEGTVDSPKQLSPVVRVVFPAGTEFEEQTFEFELKQETDAEKLSAAESEARYDEDGSVLVRGKNYISKSVTGLEDSYEVKVSNNKDKPEFENRTSVDRGTIKDLFERAEWPEAGYYVFTLKQVLPEEATGENGYVAKSIDGKDTIQIQYDPAIYEIEVEVRAGSKDGENVNFPFRIGAHRMGAQLLVKDDGDKVSFEEQTTKLETDPTKAGLTKDDLEKCVHFKNTVNVTCEKPLVINKQVNNGADGDEDIYFPFKLKLKKPKDSLIIGNPPISYKAYIVGEGDEKIMDGKANEIKVDTEGYFDIPLDEEFAFKLKDGEHLYLNEGLVGTKWRAAETHSLGFTSTGAVNVGNAVVADGYERNLETGAVTTPGVDENEFNLLLKDGNGFTALNTRNETDPPTGLFYDNLPFIVLLGLAALGIIFFVAKKTRRKEGEQA